VKRRRRAPKDTKETTLEKVKFLSRTEVLQQMLKAALGRENYEEAGSPARRTQNRIGQLTAVSGTSGSIHLFTWLLSVNLSKIDIILTDTVFCQAQRSQRRSCLEGRREKPPYLKNQDSAYCNVFGHEAASAFPVLKRASS
jgi:hypothetical protein